MELEDIEEEEELEELEEGLCHDVTQDTSDTRTRTDDGSLSEEEEKPPKSRKPKIRYNCMYCVLHVHVHGIHVHVHCKEMSNILYLGLLLNSVIVCLAK